MITALVSDLSLLDKWVAILPLFTILVFVKDFSLAGWNAGLEVLGVLNFVTSNFSLGGFPLAVWVSTELWWLPCLPAKLIKRTTTLCQVTTPLFVRFATIVPLFVLHLFVACYSLSVIRTVFFPPYIIIPFHDHLSYFRNPPIFVVTPFLLFSEVEFTV